MNSKSIAPPSVAVATQTPRWQSQIQRGFESLQPSPRVHSLLDFESTRKFIVTNACAALIVELPQSFAQKPNPTLELVTELCNNPQRCPLFLLGDDSADPWRDILAEAGANETCCSMLDFVKAWPRLERHLKNSGTSELSVEEMVTARLPW